MDHLIIAKSFRYQPEVRKEIIGFHYNSTRGLWTEDVSNKPLINCNTAIKPASKKCDVETGEDKKGQ